MIKRMVREIGIGNIVIGVICLGFFVLVVWSLIKGVVWISQLPPAPTPTATPPCVFKHTVIAKVEGSNASRVLETFEGKMWWVQPNPPSDYEWQMDKETKTAHEAWWTAVQDKDQLANVAVEKVLWQSDFILPPALSDDPNPYAINVAECGKGGVARAVTTVTVGSKYVSTYGYTTTLKLDASTGYIEIATPAGSWASIEIPSNIFFDTLTAGWNGTELPIGSIFEGPVQSDSSQKSYLDELYRTVVATKNYGLEVGSFRFALDDFEGRSQIKKALGGAMRINAANYESQVAVAIYGLVTEDQAASSFATLHADGIAALGGFLGPVGLAGGGGGETDATYSSSVTTERLLRGSVYMMPVGR